MKVLQINYSDHYRGGGAAIAMYRLNRELSRMGVDCSVLSAFKTDECMNSAPIHFYYGIESRLQKIIEFFGFRNIHPLISTYNLKKHEYYKEADIMHLNILHNDYFSYPLLPLLTRGKPTVFTLHDMWNFTGHCSYSFDCEKWETGCGSCPYPGTYPAVNRDMTSIEWKIKNMVYRNSEITFVADSSWLAECAGKSMLKKHSIIHIPYGLDTDIYKPMDKPECRKLLGLPDDKKILMVSAVDLDDYRKGSDMLIEILDKLPRKYKEKVLLLTMGDSKLSADDVKGIPCRNLGFINEDETKAALYSASDIFIHTSRAEAFGIVLLESISCGTPVIAFNVGGISDVVRHGTTGLLARPFDTDEFVSSLIGLINNIDLRNKLSVNGRKIAINEYKIEYEAGRYLNLFKELLNNKKILH